MLELRERELSDDMKGQRLRKLIREAELGVANLRGMGAEAINLLRTLDQINDLLKELEQTGMDLRPERTRLTTVEGLLRSKARILLKELKSTGGLARARQAEASLPPASRWWWYLDEIQRRKQRQRIRRWAIIAGIVGILIVGAIFAYERFLAPEPKVQQKQDLVLSAEQALAEGDRQGALRKYEAALALDPTDPELHIWVGVLAEQAGQSAEAEAHYAEAERLVADRVRFLFFRANAYQRTGQQEAALRDAEEAISLDPDAPEPHLVLAGVYEEQNNVSLALAELQKTAELAQKAGNDVLYVLARTRQAMLLQRAPALQPEGEPTPTP